MNDKISNFKKQFKHTASRIGELKSFISEHEKSKYNPMYYLYYPARTSVEMSKIQLSTYYEALRILERDAHAGVCLK